MRKTVLIDMDQILCEQVNTWLKKYHDVTKEPLLKESDITEYNLSSRVKNYSILHDILCEKNFFLDLKPIKDAVKYLQLLIDENKCDIIIATQPPHNSKYAAYEKTLWLTSRIRNFNAQNITFSHHKHLLKADILFDDAPKNLTKWKQTNPNGKICMIDYPYNKIIQTEVDFHAEKTNAWELFYEFVNKNLTTD